MVRKFTESGLGLMYQDPEYDKYGFLHGSAVDCERRLPVCHAACCRIPFALSRQDVEEGIVRWEFGRPYLIAHDAEGYCVHLDREAYRCTAYHHRPVPCRGFNCTNGDKWKVWLQYEGLLMNPDSKSRSSSVTENPTPVLRGDNEAMETGPWTKKHMLRPVAHCRSGC